MDIKCLKEYTRYDSDLELYDLTTPSFIWRSDVKFYTYTVKSEEEMRIDLIFVSIYNIEPNVSQDSLSDVDIILYINNIDNPINIRRDMVLIYPSYDDLIKFRLPITSLDETSVNIKQRLSVPNKKTRIDSDRQKFKENNYLLPPVINNKPKAPVRIANGKISIGGI